MNWTSADLDRARKAPAAAPKRPAAPRPAQATPAPVEAIRSNILPSPTIGAYPGPCSWLLGSGQVTVSLPRQWDEARLRLVLALPADPAVVGVVLAALRAHYETT